MKYAVSISELHRYERLFMERVMNRRFIYLAQGFMDGKKGETVARCDVTLIMSGDNKVEIGGFWRGRASLRQ